MDVHENCSLHVAELGEVPVQALIKPPVIAGGFSNILHLQTLACRIPDHASRNFYKRTTLHAG